MSYITLWIDNNNVVELRDLTNTVTAAVDTGANVELTIKDAAGVDVAGQVWPAAMIHDAGGLYRATLDSDLVLVAGHSYKAVVDSVGSGGEIGHFECGVMAMVRGC